MALLLFMSAGSALSGLATPSSTVLPRDAAHNSHTTAHHSSGISRRPHVLNDYEHLLEDMMANGGYNRGRLVRFFACRPAQCASRFSAFYSAYQRLKPLWAEEAVDPAEGVLRGEVLRRELAALGPVAVKLGQTLSQRPDLLSEDVCEALKPLQTANQPFEDGVALRIMADELEWDGPLAPGVVPPGTVQLEGTPLFAAVSDGPIASASLGQVYRVTTHDGRRLAVKVQRPGAVRQVSLDFAVVASVLWLLQSGGWGNGDLLDIIDIVAAGVFEELDYRNEARNAATFAKSLEFLGYVAVPQLVKGYRLSRRLIVTEWVEGHHLDALSTEDGLRLTQMAVEAVTASLVLTGYVHADPHEGNLMLGDDGRLYFLDFGLMSNVEPAIMEAFASGIMAVLNKDYDGLVQAFIATGFVGSPIEYREDTKTEFGPGSAEQMSVELRDRMEACAGGTSRFGALSTVLFDMGHNWKMYTPPYIILLIRTFLTLEGIAAQVDRDFNIYEVSLPWAIQRALSPETPEGAAALRATFLTPQNKLQWERVQELVETARAGNADDAETGAQTTSQLPAEIQASDSSPSVSVSVIGSALPMSSATAGGANALDAIGSLLGSPKGSTLRRIARDLDSTELLMRLASPEASGLRRLWADALAGAMHASLANGLTAVKNAARGVPSTPVREPLRSAASEALRRRRSTRLTAVARVLLLSHALRQLSAGWRGAAAVTAFIAVGLRVIGGALLTLAVRTGAAASLLLSAAAYAALHAAGASIGMQRLGAIATGVGAGLWHGAGRPGSRRLQTATGL